jgi:Cys-rich repeat protein
VPTADLFSSIAGPSSGCSECGNPGQDCGANNFCGDGLCQSCNVPSHCGATCMACPTDRNTCNNGQCVQCTSDAMCPSGKSCMAGSCTTPCADTSACPTGMVCDPSLSACMAPCTSTASCTSGTECNMSNGVCTIPGSGGCGMPGLAAERPAGKYWLACVVLLSLSGLWLHRRRARSSRRLRF